MTIRYKKNRGDLIKALRKVKIQSKLAQGILCLHTKKDYVAFLYIRDT